MRINPILMWHTASVVRRWLKDGSCQGWVYYPTETKNMDGQELFDKYQKNGAIYANRPI